VTGSLQEKEALDKAYRKIKKLETSSSSETQFSSIPTALEEPVNLFIHLQSESSLLLGQDVPLCIEVFNHSGGEKATHLVIGAQSLRYNGVPTTQLWKEEFHFILKSNEGKDSSGCMPRKICLDLSLQEKCTQPSAYKRLDEQLIAGDWNKTIWQHHLRDFESAHPVGIT